MRPAHYGAAEPRSWLAGCGNRTGQASARLIGIPRSARTTQEDVVHALGSA